MIDAGDLVLKCSACDRPTAVVRVVDPHLGGRYRVRATCGYGCKKRDGTADGSFWREFTGRPFPAGYGDVPEHEPEFMKLKTKVVDYVSDERDDGVVELTIHTEAC